MHRYSDVNYLENMAMVKEITHEFALLLGFPSYKKVYNWNFDFS